jgi:hypothetical protein
MSISNELPLKLKDYQVDYAEPFLPGSALVHCLDCIDGSGGFQPSSPSKSRLPSGARLNRATVSSTKC